MGALYHNVTNPIQVYLGGNTVSKIMMGSEQIWPTISALPTVTTSIVYSITSTTATGGGNVISDGGSAVTDRGVCWSTLLNPTVADSHTHDGSGTGSFTSSITGLSSGTNYYVRAWATNAAGTSYGDQTNFTSAEVLSGNGRLYNYYAINNSSPIYAAGWHVPTDAESATMFNFLGGQAVAGGKLKETGYTYWINPNTGATNESGFNGRGSGSRDENGNFGLAIKIQSIYWTSSILTGIPSGIYCWGLVNSQSSIGISNAFSRNRGSSVRLVKDDSTLTPYTGNDGKTYTTVKIGNQVWMSENLRETKYRDLSDIPQVTSDLSWSTTTTGAWCWYNNNSAYE